MSILTLKSFTPISILLKAGILAYPMALLITGCTVGPDYEQPEVGTPSAFLNASESSAPAPMSGWRELFGSPELNQLIERAESNNLTLQAAWQSVVASRTLIRRFRSEGLPQADVGLQANFFENSDALAPDGTGDSGDRYDADIVVGWELDLFGRIRRNVQAAEANSQAREAFYQDLMFSLQADVALHYFQINSLQAEIELLERSRQTRQESLELIKQRLNAGTVSELAVAQTTSLLANAESRLYGAIRIQNSLVYSLAALLGETPSTFQFQAHALVKEPPGVPAGLPGELLTRRPDIRQVERSLAAANELVGVARASFFPSIMLSGALGYATFDWDELFNSNAEFSSLRPGISVPLFQGGRLRAGEAQALANYEQRVLDYKQTVISAVTEVEDLLQSVRLLESQKAAIGRSVTASNQARRISTLQYERGLSDFITALDAERTALDAEQQFVQAKRAQYIATINLVRALGGSW